jgi:hypothetical protein
MRVSEIILTPDQFVKTFAHLSLEIAWVLLLSVGAAHDVAGIGHSHSTKTATDDITPNVKFA